MFAQTYSRLEVILVGEGLSGFAIRHLNAVDDPRVRFMNLTVRIPYSSIQEERVMHGMLAVNEGLQLATGQWLASCTEQDVFAPDALERLLTAARAQRVELVYGRGHASGTPASELLGRFPPQADKFRFSCALYHQSLRLFNRDMRAAKLGRTGDDLLVTAMLDAGVRIAMIPDVVCEHHER